MMKQSYSVKNESSFSRLRWLSLRMFNSGITTTEEASRRNHIRIMNLVVAVSFSGTMLMSVIFLTLQLYLQSLACFINAIFFVIPFYLNSKGRLLLSKVVTTIFTNCSLLAWCCIFTHQSLLNTYFLFMATACIYIYSRKEGIWLIFLVVFSLVCFMVESTSLKSLLPSLDLVKDARLLNITNFILLTGLIILLVGHVGSFVFLFSLREKKLSDTKKMLTESRKKLAAQNNDLRAFGAAASHFLQTPVFVSRLFLAKLRNEQKEQPGEKAAGYFEMIDDSLNRMEDFIKGLFSHYRILEMSTAKEDVDIQEELARIRSMLLHRFPAAAVYLPAKKIMLNTNRLLLIIVLQNVMENGLIYNKSAVPQMDVSFIGTKEGISLFFIDNGIGIDAAWHEKIFQPFVRMAQQAHTGTGLGLAGARRAAEAIKGELRCMQSSPLGSTFRLDIKS